MTTETVFKTEAGRQEVMGLYDAALAQWPFPYETKTIAARHGDAFVIACGDAAAPPLVLLHGAGTNSAIWAGDVAEYGRFHRIYAVDLLGEAGRSAPNRPSWEGPAYAEWLADVLDGLQVPQAALLGISQGGWTALKFAVTYPERATRLVLLCPGGITPDRVSFILRAIPLSMMGNWGMRRLIKMLYGSQPVPAGVAEITATVTRHFQARVGVLPIFSDEELQRLTMPTLLLGGDEDALRDNGKIAARLRALLPGLEVKILPGAGHALLDTPPHVTPFLKQQMQISL